MRVLLVIDMQEDYMGESRNRKRYPYDNNLISRVNERIDEYDKEKVIYVVNRFLWESKKHTKELVKGLQVVSDNTFEKRRQNCFTNKELLSYIKSLEADELEFVGVDGNYCVGASAYNSAKQGFKTIVKEDCVGVGNSKRYIKTKKYLKETGIIFE